MKGEKPGLALIRITYDAIAWAKDEVNTAGNYTVSSEADTPGYLFFNPIEPRNAVVIPVQIYSGEPGNGGIDPGIKYSGEYDTVYIDKAVGSAEYTFTPASASGTITSVRVHEPLHGKDLKEAWDNGWTNGIKNDDGSYTITLLDGRNIVEIKAGEAVKYYVMYAKAVDVKIEKEDGTLLQSGADVAPGEKLTISMPGLKTPVQKLSGIYNPGYPHNVWVRYYDDEGAEWTSTTGVDDVGQPKGVQYTIKVTNSSE